MSWAIKGREAEDVNCGINEKEGDTREVAVDERIERSSFHRWVVGEGARDRHNHWALSEKLYFFNASREIYNLKGLDAPVV